VSSLPPEIATAIERAVEKGISRGLEKQGCICGLAEEMGHFAGMLKDIGGGGEDGHSKGIEVVRDHVKFLTALRVKFDNLSTAVGKYILIALVGGFVALIVMGFKVWLKKSGGG